MSLDNIERFVRGGYDLRVKPYYKGGQIHAMVWLDITESSHNFIGMTVDEALAGLDRYLSDLHTRTNSPNPTDAKP